jgi:hypothetical protein
VTGKTEERVIKEVRGIRLNPKNFSRDPAFALSRSWCPVTDMIKKYTDAPVQG